MGQNEPTPAPACSAVWVATSQGSGRLCLPWPLPHFTHLCTSCPTACDHCHCVPETLWSLSLLLLLKGAAICLQTQVSSVANWGVHGLTKRHPHSDANKWLHPQRRSPRALLCCVGWLVSFIQPCFLYTTRSPGQVSILSQTSFP